MMVTMAPRYCESKVHPGLSKIGERVSRGGRRAALGMEIVGRYYD